MAGPGGKAGLRSSVARGPVDGGDPRAFGRAHENHQLGPGGVDGLPRKVPSVALVDVAQATSSCTRTKVVPRRLGTARANSMSEPRWWDRYSAPSSVPPLSRIWTSSVRSASAPAQSAEASARWKRSTVAATSVDSAGRGGGHEPGPIRSPGCCRRARRRAGWSTAWRKGARGSPEVEAAHASREGDGGGASLRQLQLLVPTQRDAGIFVACKTGLQLLRLEPAGTSSGRPHLRQAAPRRRLHASSHRRQLSAQTRQCSIPMCSAW